MTDLFDSFIRMVASPLTEQMLRPLDPRCRWVQFNRALSDTDYQVLAAWLATYPTVILRVYGGYDGSITDLDFLRHFPTLLAFQADDLYNSLASLDGLTHLPAQLRYLGLGQTRRRLSLAPLARFTALRRLSLEGHTKDLDVLTQPPTLTSLTLRVHHPARPVAAAAADPAAGARPQASGSFQARLILGWFWLVGMYAGPVGCITHRAVSGSARSV